MRNRIKDFWSPPVRQAEESDRRRRYGDFLLTNAVRLPLVPPIIPRAGYTDRWTNNPIGFPNCRLLTVAASAEYLFDLWLELLGLCQYKVDVYLEDHWRDPPSTWTAFGVRRRLLTNTVSRFEDLLLNDGFTSLVVNSVCPRHGQYMVLLDQCKLLHVDTLIYSRTEEKVERILERYELPFNRQLALIPEGESFHVSADYFQVQFQQLCARLGCAAQNS
jgi:hypothetical protein